MLFDLQEERGMPVLDERFGDPDECRFPLFPSWKLPPLEYIALAYLVMVIGALTSDGTKGYILIYRSMKRLTIP